MNIQEYYESKQIVMLSIDQLNTDKKYRGVHSGGVARMKQVLISSKYSIQNVMVVKRNSLPEDDINNKQEFQVVDGMHRVTAMLELLHEFGRQQYVRLMGTDIFPCFVLRHDTPEYVLTAYAARTNDANNFFTPMSWIDGILNITKFAISFADDRQKRLAIDPDPKQKSRSIHWAAQNHQTLRKARGQGGNWTDFQKKMVLRLSVVRK